MFTVDCCIVVTSVLFMSESSSFQLKFLTWNSKLNDNSFALFQVRWIIPFSSMFTEQPFDYAVHLLTQGSALPSWTTASTWWGVIQGRLTWTRCSATTPSQTAGWTPVAWCTAAVTLALLLFDPWGSRRVIILKERQKLFAFLLSTRHSSLELRSSEGCCSCVETGPGRREHCSFQDSGV